MQITKNFTLAELTDSTTARIRKIDNTPNEEPKKNLIQLIKNILQPVRDKFNHPITVNSGFRSINLNKAVGGVATSQHLKGEAADITSHDNKKLWDLFVSMIKNNEIEVGQLIWEKGNSKAPKWIHVSLPTKKHKNQILRL